MKTHLLLGIHFILCYSQVALPADAPALPAAAFRFTVESNEPLYRTIVPGELYQFSQTGSLRDISITNGNGEQVPYAVIPYKSLHPGKLQIESSQPLHFHVIAENRLNESEAINIQLERQANETTLNIKSSSEITAARPAYLVDLGEKHQPLHNLTLDWLGSDNALIHLELQASDNLKDWSYIDQVVLLKSRQNGQSVIINSFNLPTPISARYLQLRPATKIAGDFKLIKVATSIRDDAYQPAPYQWTALRLLERQQKDNGITALSYEVDGRYPVSQLRISLPEANTITSVSISMRNTTRENWRHLISATIFRINENGHVTASPDISIPESVARFWQLQFDQSNGGIGADNPALAAGWLPHFLVWNARGRGPFQLTTGNNPDRANSMAISDLIPDYEARKVLELPLASLTVQSANSQSSENMPTIWPSDIDYRNLFLWGGLIIGVMLLALMAYSLFNSEKTKR